MTNTISALWQNMHGLTVKHALIEAWNGEIKLT